MKRCSQCHFTFEDHVENCDFDGTELEPYVEPSREVKLLFEGPRLLRLFRNRAFQALLTLFGIISSALLIGYYDAVSQSIDQRRNARAEASSTNLARGAQAAEKPATQPSKKSLVTAQVEVSRSARASAAAQRIDAVEPRAPRPMHVRNAVIAREPSSLRPAALLKPGGSDRQAPFESDAPRPSTLGPLASRPPRAQSSSFYPPLTVPTSQIAGSNWPQRAGVATGGSIVGSTSTPPSASTPPLEQLTPVADMDEPSTPTLILKKTGSVIKKAVGLFKRPFSN